METKGSGRLTVARLSVRNVLGVEDHTIDVDRATTVISGKNASGKSSHLAALRSALGIDRTALARLARIHEDGAAPAAEGEEPSVEVLLVDETGERELLVSRKGGESPEVRERVGADWRKVPRPVEYLRGLIDVQAAVPALWLEMDDEQKAQAVLEAMPLENYSRAEALKQAGLEGFRLPPIPAGLHALEDLEQIEAAVFSARTEVNRQQRAEHDAATKLLSGLPAAPPEEIGDRVAKLEASTVAAAAEIARQEAGADAAEHQAVAAAQSTQAALEASVAADFKLSAAKLRREHDAKAAEIRAEAEREIADLLARTEAAINDIRMRGEEAIESGAQAAEHQVGDAQEIRQAARAEAESRKADLAQGREALAGLRAQQQSIETDRHVRATAAAAEAKAREHEARAAELTAALAALTAYKLRLAEQLPIKGLAVVFSEKGKKSLTLDGIPLSTVNSGRLYRLATEVTLIRNDVPDDGSPRVRLVLLDGLEKLDRETQVGVLRECAERGTQVIACVVSEASLQVLSGEAALGGEAA